MSLLISNLRNRPFAAVCLFPLDTVYTTTVFFETSPAILFLGFWPCDPAVVTQVIIPLFHPLAMLEPGAVSGCLPEIPLGLPARDLA